MHNVAYDYFVDEENPDIYDILLANSLKRKTYRSMEFSGIAPFSIAAKENSTMSYTIYGNGPIQKWEPSPLPMQGNNLINNAKIELAGLISTEVTALTESTVGNTQITSEDATSINEAVQAGKSLIAQKLGRTFVVTECYRQLNKKNVEVSVTIAYNEQMAMDMAKAVIRKNLEEKGKDLHEQLDKMWESLKE